MTVLPIVYWPDAKLKTACSDVENLGALGHLVSDMLETMYAASGRGLAAPQVSVLKRLFVMDVEWKEGGKSPVVMINPRILGRSPEIVEMEEGCLSIPGLMIPVARPRAVQVAWSDIQGRDHVGSFDGFAARCIQHEYDHLEGSVTLDHLPTDARRRAEARYDQINVRKL